MMLSIKRERKVKLKFLQIVTKITNCQKCCDTARPKENPSEPLYCRQYPIHKYHLEGIYLCV